MGGERSVVFGYVLLVEGGTRVSEPGWGAVDGRHVDKEVRAPKVVVVGLLLRMVKRGM